MSSDPLSDALGLVRARCLISRGFTAGGRPWALRFDARHRLKLHAVVRGDCWLILDGQPPVRLEEGDLAVTNGTVPFILASDPTVPPLDAEQVFATNPTPIVPLGGDEVIGIAGHVRMERCCEDLILAALPTLTRIRAADPAATVLRYLLDRVLRELAHPGPGSEFAGEQYAQLILVEVLRVVLDVRNVPETGWLRLVSDSDLRPALALMHEHPAHPWRLTDLAQAVSMSRSTFATRFRTLSGVPPLTYLHNWRIRLAQAALRDTDATVASLASQYGYASESSFSHAFTRTAGVSPRRYRSLHRNRATP